MSFVRESVKVGDALITLETGRLAKQAHGSVLVTCGETMVLVTVCGSDAPRPGIDFFPLSVDYIEKTYAAGKIPGGFFKREGKLKDDEVLVSRLIDRPCRPLFPDGYRNDVQIIATVLSADKVNDPDVLSMTGASAALTLSDIPWAGPIAGVRVARISGKLVVNPTFEQRTHSDIDIVVAASKDAIVMVEGAADEVPEDEFLDALIFAHKAAQPIIALQEQLRAAVGKVKKPFVAALPPKALVDQVKAIALEDYRQACTIRAKSERYNRFKEISKKVTEAFASEPAEIMALVKVAIHDVQAFAMRTMITDRGVRIDGRDTRTVRPITCEVGLIPRTHGSALFTRGETQSLVTVTLGTRPDEQKIDGLNGEKWKRFYLHYNFPPFSVGETKPMRGPGRREVGHGNLAERALARVMPSKEQFPYVVRVVSEILESNGSSSMASVCGGCLALMDAGVPVKAPVAGVAMGLIKEGDRFAVLTDILGDEDHLGDMDFKVCGTAKGITAIQMDIKIEGLSREILKQALEQAREGRLHILGKMLEALPQARTDLSVWAPRLTSLKVKPDQIRLIIGSGGKTIKGIVDATGVQIEVEDDGTVNIASSDSKAVQRAIDIIRGLTAEAEIGVVYRGTVKRIMDFGAFVEIFPGTEGLLHISELDFKRVADVRDIVKEGDQLEVKVLSVEDGTGKIRLSRKATLPMPEGYNPEESRGERRFDRGERDGDRRSDRGDRRDRGERGDRGARFDRGERRFDRSDRGDRAPREEDVVEESAERQSEIPQPIDPAPLSNEPVIPVIEPVAVAVIEEERPRRERRERSDRGDRAPREERSERPAREEPRAERAPREERVEGEGRSARRERSERGDRAPREERPAREERVEGEERPARRERSDRGDRAPREERPAREERGDRAPREERAAREEYRAERLRRESPEDAEEARLRAERLASEGGERRPRAQRSMRERIEAGMRARDEGAAPTPREERLARSDRGDRADRADRAPRAGGEELPPRRRDRREDPTE